MVDQEEKNEKKGQDSGDLQSSEEQEEVFESAPVKPKEVMVTDEELRALQKEVMEYKDKYLRLLADAENARKRLNKEKQEMIRYALENLINDFLRPIDNLDNALRMAQEMSDEVKNWAFGFQMILSQFKDVLTQNGVMPIDSLGKPFDPHFHEAIEMVESTTQPPGVIVEESLRGYKMGDRMIRPARVKVSKAQERPVQENLTDSKENHLL